MPDTGADAPPLAVAADVAACPTLTPAAKLALAALAEAAIGGVYRRPANLLRLRIGLADRQMRQALAELVEAGRIVPQRQPGQATVWALAVTPPQDPEFLPVEAPVGEPDVPRMPPHPLSPSWVPSRGVLARVRRLRPDLDLSLELAKFSAWFGTGPGRDERRVAWSPSFERWCERADGQGQRPAAARAPGGARAADGAVPLTPSGQRLARIAGGSR